MTGTHMTDDTTALGPRLERLKLRHLQLLDQVMQCGSLSAAAQQLGISQPAATKMLHELEAAFGHSLVTRTPRGARLTPAGEHALERIRIALGSLSTARATMGEAQDRPLVRLGLLPLVGIGALGPVVNTLQQRGGMPRMILRTDTIQGLLDLLVRGEVDAVVGGLDGEWVPKNMHQLDVVTLWQLSLAVVAAKDHPLTRCPSVSWAQTLDHDWVLMPHGSSSRRTVERSFLAAGLAPPPACIETASFHIGLDLAANTRLLAVVPNEAYEKNRSRVSRLPMIDPFPASHIVWVTLRGVPTLPAVKTLANAFAAYAGQLAT